MATPENDEIIDIMKSVLDSASLPGNMTLYRGTSTEEAFMDNLHITIEAQKGAHALDISPISIFKNEAEILFNSGQEMFIKSAMMKDGKLYITVVAE